MADSYTRTIPEVVESSTNGDLSVEEARKILERADQEARQAFMDDINEVCERHGYTLSIDAKIVIAKTNG